MKIYTPKFGEEVANAISHGVMMIITLTLIPYTAVALYIEGGGVAAAAGSIYVIAIFLMFLTSTLYHSMSPTSRHKQIMHTLDHIFIYVAIAGTYTPIALCVLGGWQGVFITSLQWAMVLFGVLYKSLATRSMPAVSLTIYLVMGWSVVIFAPLLLRNASVEMLALLLAGGVFYSVGAYFYARKGFRYHHLVWHIFINLAMACHYVAVVRYMYA